MDFIEAAAYLIFVVLVVALISTVPLYFLWNWLMPDIFGLTQITFFQAFGISILSGILFKNSSSKSKE